MTIVKIGGGFEINIEGIVSNLAKYSDKFVIVHGANAFRDELASKLNVQKKVITSVKGYSSVYTDQEALDILLMAYAGLRNKRIVELCHKHGINAVGLTGLDGKLVEGKRNSGIRVRDDGKLKLVHDVSGKPKQINSHLLNLLINENYVPVITVPIIDENNNAINSENDDIIAVLNEAIKAGRVIQFIEAKGFLLDSKNPESVIDNLTRIQLTEIEEKVEGRMKRKIHALNKLLANQSTEIIIADGRVENPLTDALNGKGTVIK